MITKTWIIMPIAEEFRLFISGKIAVAKLLQK
jgi:hypothetical protein